MKQTLCCPKCGSREIVRVPDHPGRHASGNNIDTTTWTLLGKIPVIATCAAAADTWRTGWNPRRSWRRSAGFLAETCKKTGAAYAVPVMLP